MLNLYTPSFLGRGKEPLLVIILKIKIKWAFAPSAPWKTLVFPEFTLKRIHAFNPKLFPKLLLWHKGVNLLSSRQCGFQYRLQTMIMHSQEKVILPELLNFIFWYPSQHPAMSRYFLEICIQESSKEACPKYSSAASQMASTGPALSQPQMVPQNLDGSETASSPKTWPEFS